MSENQRTVCGGRQLAAVEGPVPADRPPPWRRTDVVGKPLCRIDAFERVSGRAVYPSDVVLPCMLYGAILCCPHPHAVV